MTETAQMRTWAEISLDRLAHNYQTLRAMLAPDCRFLGLCKANAYGHGALQVGRKLEALGADMLAVACVDEAAELRRGGVTIPILCLGQTPPQLAELLLEDADPDCLRPGDRPGPGPRGTGCGTDAEDPREGGHRHDPAGLSLAGGG